MQFFTQWPTDWQDTYLYPDYAALYMDFVPLDTSIWYTVSGSYVPDSAYTKLAIGNFFSYDLIDVLVIDTVFGLELAAYAFIDDVKVQYATDCSTLEVGGQNGREALRIGPNPCHEQLVVELIGVGLHGIAAYELLDTEGRMWRARSGLGGVGRVKMDMRQLAPGIYLLGVLTESGKRTTHMIMHTSP